MARSLRMEIAYFDDNFDALKRGALERGKSVVLVHDCEVAGYFDTVDEATRYGYEHFKGDLFLARSVTNAPEDAVIASIVRS